MRNVHGILDEKPKEKRPLWETGVGRNIILKWISEKPNVDV